MRKKSISTIVLISSLLLTIMLLDTGILFSQMRMQTRQSGGFQIESVSGKLESTINEAENLTMRMALRAREYLADKDALRDFIYSEKQDILSKHAGAFNIYIAGRDFAYIPDFDMPEDYIATERVWYIGALKNHGQAYVSSPYQDAMTGDICYTVSVMLGDGHTVLGIDYTLETIQEYISQMADKAITAVIVTDEGIIAGCSDKSLVGRKLIDALPDYAGIYTTAKNKEGVSTGRIKSGLLYENLFAAKSGSEWYLIVSVSDFEMYRDSYIQLLMTLVLSLALFSIIIVLYVATVRSREKAENALYSRERFLTHITSELQEPLCRIMERSGRSREGRIENYEEEMASIYHAGEQLSEMVEQIISYKSIILGTQDAQKNTRSKKAAGMDKRFRILIIAIMVFVMLLSLYTNMAATYRWGNARMVSGSKTYEYQLAEWINTQKSILDMFVSVIST
ncbi:MAG: cache domain-containing protein, partial [Lachnospiraceae bacterium]|nr:cache domain-containing protein [Lachnospiraceae bacterium]